MLADHSADNERYSFQQGSRLGIQGVTLHGYRYGWAERAKDGWLPGIADSTIRLQG